MSTQRGSQIFVGYAQSGLLGVHRDPTHYVACESFDFTPEAIEIERELLTPGQYHESVEHQICGFNYSGNMTFDFHPAEGIHLLKGALSNITSTELTGAGVYEHQFLGSDDIPMPKGFSFTLEMDRKVFLFSGVVVTTVEKTVELDGAAKMTVNWVAKLLDISSDGTSGTSQGQNAMSFTVTLVADTSDQIKLAIDGGSAVEVTIAAGAYTTAALLEAAVNTAIEGTTGLLDSDGNPEVACYVDSNDKINFYTADKGSGSEVTWTAGTNDANTLLGYGTPVEAAGSDTIGTPTYSTVDPYKACQISLLYEGSEIYIDKLSITIDVGVIGKRYLGHKYMRRPQFEKKRVITGTYEKDYENEDEITAWAANSDVALKVQYRTGIVAAGGVEYDADEWLQLVKITNAPHPKPTQGTIRQVATFKAYKKDAIYLDYRVDIINLLSSI